MYDSLRSETLDLDKLKPFFESKLLCSYFYGVVKVFRACFSKRKECISDFVCVPVLK